MSIVHQYPIKSCIFELPYKILNFRTQTCKVLYSNVVIPSKKGNSPNPIKSYILSWLFLQVMIGV